MGIHYLKLKAFSVCRLGKRLVTIYLWCAYAFLSFFFLLSEQTKLDPTVVPMRVPRCHSSGPTTKLLEFSTHAKCLMAHQDPNLITASKLIAPTMFFCLPFSLTKKMQGTDEMQR